MNDFIQDTWQDLRDKRLWPVAVVLALAIVAIPILLTKSAAQPPVADPVADSASASDRVTVQLEDGDAASSGTGSALDKFEKGDPFTPPSRISAASAGSDAAAGATAAGPSDAGGSGGGGGGESSPAPAPDSQPVAAPPTTRTETSSYEYVADVTFWTGDRRRKVRGLRKLDMLPNQSAPVLIFMGASKEGGNAVFLVDSTLKAAGEGRCVPSGANCAYVHLGPGSEHTFSTAEGDAYRLRIEEIRRVKVKAGSARSAARASTGAATRRFELPSLADLVEETVVTTGPSSVGTDGR